MDVQEQHAAATGADFSLLTAAASRGSLAPSSVASDDENWEDGLMAYPPHGAVGCNGSEPSATPFRNPALPRCLHSPMNGEDGPAGCDGVGDTADSSPVAPAPTPGFPQRLGTGRSGSVFVATVNTHRRGSSLYPGVQSSRSSSLSLSAAGGLPPAPAPTFPLPNGTLQQSQLLDGSVDEYTTPVSANVAVKTIRENSKEKADSADREVKFAKRQWQHTGASCTRIVRIHRVRRCRTSGTTCIFMELLPGTTAADAAARLRDENVLRDVACDALEGLRFLHEELRVVHRDIKPSNLLLDHDGRVKIADFGVAAVLDPAADVRTGVNDQAGTLSYMSPERLRGDAHGAPGDVWALGVTLLELAGGEHPYAARAAASSSARFWGVAAAVGALEGPAEREARVDALIAEHVAARAADLPDRAGFEAFVRRAMHAEPGERATAAELLQDAWITSGSE
mmetsp:Transcript_22477/g.69739  ORF Transcript_22477/g.69739 Transcript_22477/m.69739 type:complete len:453 (-) Transcript_22477:704-2062(-)